MKQKNLKVQIDIVSLTLMTNILKCFMNAIDRGHCKSSLRHGDAARSLVGDEEMRGPVKIQSPSLLRITFIHSLVRLFLHSHISCIDRYDDSEDNLATY
jgi:hypothetical protein